MKNSKVLANQQIIRRYQHRSWYMGVILFTIAVLVVLHFTETPVISPCPQEGCFVKVVYAKETKPEIQEIVDYILKVFEPSGWDNQVRALSCFISESKLRPDAYNYNTNDTWDFGVAQWNQVHGQTIDQIRDWHTQVDLAYKLFLSQGWTPWYGRGCH